MSARTKAPATEECTCPRLEEETERYGYREGCRHTARLCCGCDHYREQVGWGWGLLGYSGLVRWLCSTCRIPAPPNVAAEAPDFVTTLELEDEVRYAVVAALSTAATRVGPSDTADVLLSMSKQLRGGTGLDVDMSHLDVEGRRRVEVSLHTAAYANSTPQSASTALARLFRLFSTWLDGQLPAEVPPVPWHERRAAERAAMLAGLERKATR